jgi:hypothetical protein
MQVWQLTCEAALQDINRDVRLNLSVDEVRQQYEAIAAQFPVELILEWCKGS